MGQGGHKAPGAESLGGAEKSQQCRKHFNTVHLLPEDLIGSNMGASNLFLASGSI